MSNHKSFGTPREAVLAFPSAITTGDGTSPDVLRGVATRIDTDMSITWANQSGHLGSYITCRHDSMDDGAILQTELIAIV